MSSSNSIQHQFDMAVAYQRAAKDDVITVLLLDEVRPPSPRLIRMEDLGASMPPQPPVRPQSDPRPAIDDSTVCVGGAWLTALKEKGSLFHTEAYGRHEP
jgi:hypothetical protein